MRLLPIVPLVMTLAACGTGPTRPTVWTANDLYDALQANLASVGAGMGGQWAPAGGCDGLTLPLDLGDDRPGMIPDVSAWFTAVSGASLTLAAAQPAAGEQVYTLDTAAGADTVIRDLATDGITWQMSDRGALKVFPSYLGLEGPALSLHVDADTVSVQAGGAPAITFERCS